MVAWFGLIGLGVRVLGLGLALVLVVLYTAGGPQSFSRKKVEKAALI